MQAIKEDNGNIHGLIQERSEHIIKITIQVFIAIPWSLDSYPLTTILAMKSRAEAEILMIRIMPIRVTKN